MSVTAAGSVLSSNATVYFRVRQESLLYALMGAEARDMQADFVQILTSIPTNTSIGEVNWHDVAAAINAIKFEGPVLFEINPSVDVFANLRISRDSLRAAGMHV